MDARHPAISAHHMTDLTPAGHLRVWHHTFRRIRTDGPELKRCCCSGGLWFLRQAHKEREDAAALEALYDLLHETADVPELTLSEQRRNPSKAAQNGSLRDGVVVSRTRLDKERENAAALEVLPDLLRELDALAPGPRLAGLVQVQGFCGSCPPLMMYYHAPDGARTCVTPCQHAGTCMQMFRPECLPALL